MLGCGDGGLQVNNDSLHDLLGGQLYPKAGDAVAPLFQSVPPDLLQFILVILQLLPQIRDSAQAALGGLEGVLCCPGRYHPSNLHGHRDGAL